MTIIRNEQRKQDLINQKDKTAMLGVLFGQGEVLVIIIVTALVVFLILRRHRRRKT